MNYRVAWTPSAQQHLAHIWLASADRGTVTSAAAQIDATLQTAPRDQGESRDGAVRVLICPPLGVLYEVIDDDRTVYVIAAWTTVRTPE